MKKNSNILTINYFFVLILALTYTYYLSDLIDLNRHWSSVFDHELVLGYNALLFNSAIEHQYNVHSGYFTILFLSIFLKICNFLGLLSTYKFSILNNNNNLDVDLQSVIFFVRIYSLICISFFLLTINIIFNYFSKNIIYAFLLTALVAVSMGTLVHTQELRTELLAMTFFIISFFNLILFFRENNSNKIINITLFFLFLFCAILNKSQIFFYLPCILVLSYFNINKISDFDTKNFNFLNHKKTPTVMFFTILFYLILKNLSQYDTFLATHSSIFLILIIILINLFFYFCFLKIKIKIFENLIVINFIWILVFVFYKSLLFIHPSTVESSFQNTFTNIMSVVFYTEFNPMFGTGAKSGTNNFILLTIISKLIIGFFSFIYKTFSTINFYGVLIILNILITLLFRKKLNKNLILFNLFCIVSYFFISSINLMRPTAHYLIFSDFFLILPFCNFGFFLKKKYSMIILPFLALIIFFIFETKRTEFHQKIYVKNNIKVICDISFFYDYLPNIKKEEFNKFCNKNK